ncbi:MAG TPA: hypothetical protein VKB38_19000 [Terracidiphilus sp.]|nr:hypothetical protein [Terracidiphilus sp.]
MTHTVRVLPHPKDRRRVAHAKGTHKGAHAHSPAKASHPVAGDEHEETHDRTVNFLEICWPTVFGILLAIIADHLRLKVISEWGDTGDRIVFPFVQIFSRPELGLGELGSNLSHLMLHLQFPLTGLYASWNLSRHHRLSTTILQIGFVYGVIAFVLWLLTAPGASHGL